MSVLTKRYGFAHSQFYSLKTIAVTSENDDIHRIVSR